MIALSNPLLSSARDDWETPSDLFDACHAEFGFDFDAAAIERNAKLPRFIGPDDDALKARWSDYGRRAWLNPPYGRKIGAFLDAAVRALDDGVDVVVALVPARTDTAWFQRALSTAYAVWFLRGRVRFVGADAGATFPSALIVWNRANRTFGYPALPMRAWGVQGPSVNWYVPLGEVDMPKPQTELPLPPNA